MRVYTHDPMKAIMLLQREKYWLVSEYTEGRRVFHLMPTDEGFALRYATIVREPDLLEQSIIIRPYINEGEELLVHKSSIVEKHEHPWCKGEPVAVVWTYDTDFVGMVNANRLLYLRHYPLIEAPSEELEQMVLNDWYSARATFTRYPLPNPNLEQPIVTEEEEEDTDHVSHDS